ncbi:hypothetical protein ACFPM0_28560 [Pseudonocardia sulfidoxydans]
MSPSKGGASSPADLVAESHMSMSSTMTTTAGCGRDSSAAPPHRRSRASR